MSKFCGNCGAQLDDNAVVCGYCGVNLEEKSTVKNIPGIVSEKDEEKIKKAKKTIKSVGIVAIAVVVVVIAFNIISGFVGCKGAVRKVMNAYEDYDINTLVSMASDLNFYGTDNYEYIEERFEDIVSDKLDSYEESVGYDLKIKYDIVGTHKLPERNLTELLSQLEDNDVDTSQVKEIRLIELTITVKGSRGTNEYESSSLLMVKENGKWKAFYKDLGYYY